MASGLKVTAPATISNLKCGFDVLGMATDLVADEIIGRRTVKPGVHILQITGPGKQDISTDPSLNTAGRAVEKFFDYTGSSRTGIEMEIHKYIPAGSGLGSSASSACAAVVLADALFDTRLLQQELIALAILGEYISCRAYHSDNVAPCIMGGIVLSTDIFQLDFQRLRVPRGIYLTIVQPEMRVLTSAARSALAQTVLLKDATRQTANIASFVLALEREDIRLIGRSMQDSLIEHQRAHFIPGYQDILNAAYGSGALVCGMSGSGPALFALSQNSLTAEAVGETMVKSFEAHRVNARYSVSSVSHQGTTLQ